MIMEESYRKRLKDLYECKVNINGYKELYYDKEVIDYQMMLDLRDWGLIDFNDEPCDSNGVCDGSVIIEKNIPRWLTRDGIIEVNKSKKELEKEKRKNKWENIYYLLTDNIIFKFIIAPVLVIILGALAVKYIDLHQSIKSSDSTIIEPSK